MPRLVFAALALGLVSALPAFAAPTPTGKCLVEAKTDSARAACIGETARVCEKTFAAPTPLDQAVCLNDETEWWRKRLHAAYERMASRAEKLDAINEAANGKGGPRLRDDLDALQDSWKDWTEKRCTFDAMLLRGDPRRMVVAADCMLHQTAEQTLLLERSATPSK